MDFKLGSIPVRIHGWFIIMAVVLGSNDSNPARLATWVAIVFVSVLVHELGHALVGRAFGLVPRIELHGMGGTTAFEAPANTEPRPLGAARNVAISLAGPFAGFALALVLFALQRAGLRPHHPLARHAIGLLFAVNVGWGIFNLLPMLPLDGGNVLRSILVGATKKRPELGDKIARVISVVIASAIAILAVQRREWWILYLGALYAFRNVQALRQAGQERADQSLADAIELGYRALERDQPRAAIALLEPAFARGSEASLELRQAGIRVYVAALLRDDRVAEAVDMIERERRLIDPTDLERIVTALRDKGREAEAERVLAVAAKTPETLGEFRA
jgi:stage IV sporulation protein FB